MKTTSHLLAGALVLVLASAPAEAQTGAFPRVATRAFDATGHVKAQGARVKIEFPAGWAAREGQGPKIVQNFIGDYAGVPAVLSLAIEAGDEQHEAACARASREDLIAASAMPDATVVNARVFRRKGKPAAILGFTQVRHIGGSIIHSQSETMLVCHRRYLVKASCVTGGTTPQLATLNMRKIAPLCGQYVDSLAIGD